MNYDDEASYAYNIGGDVDGPMSPKLVNKDHSKVALEQFLNILDVKVDQYASKAAANTNKNSAKNAKIGSKK